MKWDNDCMYTGNIEEGQVWAVTFSDVFYAIGGIVNFLFVFLYLFIIYLYFFKNFLFFLKKRIALIKKGQT